MGATVDADTPGTILLVDDEPANLTVLDATLTRVGHTVAAFPRGELALAAAPELAPELILLDVRMPGMDGYEVCRRLKADPRLAPIPVIFISAMTGSQDVAEGFEVGGVDYVAKPFREVEVLARVRTHIALGRAYAALAAQNERLRQLERHRDTLVHMMVHDMRSPLQAMLGGLELIDESPVSTLDPSDRASLLESIHATRVLCRMVSTVIDVSRMESLEVPLKRRPTGIRELLRAALAQSVGNPPHRVVLERIHPACPSLQCDPEVTARVLANLLANALKYAPGPEPLEVGAEPGPEGALLWVRDRGPGIPVEHQARIFEKFAVVEQALEKGRPTSSGLGLAFCKLAVEAQGGQIGVESAPGHGTRFWFTVPAA